jgi:FKBP-type peptidyl-prolyl cis-trans isomerase FkpA
VLRIIIFSLFALVALALGARGCGVTPEQVEATMLLAELNAEEGAAYRSENRRREGVIELPSGLQLETVRLGDGVVPKIDEWVVVHYRGQHLDGRVFEDSWRRGDPAVLPVNRAIVGWQQALVAMPVGSRVRLVIPPELAYGRAGGGPIGPEETLLFEVELLERVDPPRAQEREALQQAVPGLSR